MRKKWFLFLVTLTVLFTGLVTMAGCQGYETFTLGDNEIRFSFEYPASYSVVDSQIGVTSHFLFHYWQVTLEAKERTAMRTTIQSMIPHDGEHNLSATTWLEDTLSWQREREGFKLLRRNIVTIAGVVGEEIVFVSPTSNILVGSWFSTEQLYTWRMVFFDFAEDIWVITLKSDDASVRADRAIFYRMLNTFKILD